MEKEFEALEIVSRALCFEYEGVFEETEEKYYRVIFNDMVDEKEKAILEETIVNNSTIKQALTELQAIKEANPSEALKELNEIIEYITEDKRVKYKATILFDCKIIKQALLKAQELEKENSVLKACIKDWEDDYEHLKFALYKEKEVLEVVFKKEVSISYLKSCIFDTNIEMFEDGLEEYNFLTSNEDRLTQEEFDLLKRWCEKCQK